MRKLAGLATTLAVATGFALPTPARAQAATTVAVVPFNVRASGTDTVAYSGIGTAVADLLATELRAVTGVRVTDRAPTGRTVALQPKTRGGFVGREGAVEAARVLGAQHVVFGGFATDAAGNVRLDARAANVGSGTVEATERLQGRGDQLVSLVRQLAARLENALALTAPVGATPSPTIPLAGLADYGKALEATDRGDRARARQLLEGVLRDHPDFAPARSALVALGDR